MSASRDHDQPRPDQVARLDAKTQDRNAKAEARRVKAVKKRGHVPADTYPLPEGPARGTFRAVQTFDIYPEGNDGYVTKPAGYKGRRTLHRSDSFDVAIGQAAKNGKAPPFTPSQIAIGRAYRDLVERFEGSGMRGSSLEIVSGCGDPDAHTDAILRDGKRLRILKARIGQGAAMEVRRVRPSKRGSRVTISDQSLIDCFVLRQLSVSEILGAHGWSAYADTRNAVRKALCRVLDRMIGPVPKGIQTTRFGADVVPIWDQIDSMREQDVVPISDQIDKMRAK